MHTSDPEDLLTDLKSALDPEFTRKSQAGMPRSASDATRFTATGPYATAKPSAKPSLSIPIGNVPSGETSQQKIARLRAAAAQARAGKESSFDKVVRVGRVWADRAHRFTTLSLIGLTGTEPRQDAVDGS